MPIEHVPGAQKADIMLYALSTCGWCRKAKQHLTDLGLAYRYVFVDQLEGDERQKTVAEITRWNPACSFPTMVIDNARCIVGFNPGELDKIAGK